MFTMSRRNPLLSGCSAEGGVVTVGTVPPVVGGTDVVAVVEVVLVVVVVVVVVLLDDEVVVVAVAFGVESLPQAGSATRTRQPINKAAGVDRRRRQCTISVLYETEVLPRRVGRDALSGRDPRVNSRT
ncbi:MAG: hypothetical protein ACR2MO_16350 [Acidimicrobiales bacterium]